jgi:hypothetical protein
MASNFKTQTQKRNTRPPIPILEENRDYKRIKFSLKMALRMVNGHFSQLNVLQYNQSGINFENSHEKGSVDCWIAATGNLRDEIQKN